MGLSGHWKVRNQLLGCTHDGLGAARGQRFREEPCASYPTHPKNLPVVNSGKQRIQAEVGPAASRVQSESSDLAWASVPGEARQKAVLILCKLRYDGSRARTEDRPVAPGKSGFGTG